MKTKLFNPNMMKYVDENISWREAVFLGVEMLVKNKKSTWELENKILESTNKWGAYYVLEEGLALVHAEAGPHCLEPATSLLLLKDNIVFNEQSDKKAKIIITLSAPDNASHTDFIVDFGKIFMNEELKKNLLNTNSIDEFVKLIERFENNEN